MGINRSGFYKWKERLLNPSIKEITRQSDVKMFIEYHNNYPRHGYRWLNAKIKLDTGTVYSDNYAFKCCKYAGIKSQAKKLKYKRPKDATRVFPNLLLQGITPNSPMEVIVSDMTAFKVKNVYYELTFYMDLFNNEIVAYGLVSKRGDRNSYYDGLNELIQKKKEYQNLEIVLHTDQGSVYSSKPFNDLLIFNGITHSTSNPGTPTKNGAMEAINGWAKEELFTDFNIYKSDNVEESIKEYVHYFNYKRPTYSLNYLTPIQYKQYTF